MRLSRAFLPTLKETPAEAQIASHRLMLRAGLVRQTSAGIYAWLPAGLRVLKRVEQIVREEQDRAGAQEILMPTIQPAELWRDSGRYDDYGKEMLRIRDRQHLQDLRQVLPRPAAQPVSHPVEVPRRGAPALRRDARARIPDEGRLFLRRDARGCAPFLPPDVPGLPAHLPAHGPDRGADACGHGADRRRPQPRIHHPRRDRRERRLLRCDLRDDGLGARPSSTA